jgi:hypothetical protein
MHILIPPSDLNAMIYTFLDEISSNQRGTGKHRQVAAFTNHQQRPAQPSFEHDKKRKRPPMPNNIEPGPAPKKAKTSTLCPTCIGPASSRAWQDLHVEGPKAARPARERGTEFGVAACPKWRYHLTKSWLSPVPCFLSVSWSG